MIQTIDQLDQFITELQTKSYQDPKKNSIRKEIIIPTQDMQLINHINSELGINLMLECTALDPVKQNTYFRFLDSDVYIATNSKGHAAVRLARCKYIKLVPVYAGRRSAQLPSYSGQRLYVAGIFSYTRVTNPRPWKKTSPKVVLNSVNRPIGVINVSGSVDVESPNEQKISFEFTTNPNNLWI